MPTETIRPSSETSLIGALRSSDATWATARAGSGTLTSFASATTIPGGVRLFTGTYDLNEMFFGFTPAAAVPNAVVTGVTFEWTNNSANVSGGEVQAILEFAAGPITTADWQDGTELAALTVWGSIPKSGTYQTNNATNQVSLNSTAIAAVQTALRAGTTISFMVVDQNQIDDIAPAGNDRYDILSEQNGTAANRPALIIDYRMPPVMDHHYRMMR